MGFYWRTKPRSVIKAVLWYKEFAKLEGQNWDEQLLNNGKKYHPTRREYLYNVHKEDDPDYKNVSFHDFVNNGKFISTKDKESSARNDKTTYEFFGFGYVDKSGIVHNNDVGNKIVADKMDSEMFLSQLLKLHFPNAVQHRSEFDSKDPIFPMELLLIALKKYDYLQYGEISLLFGCVKKSLIKKTLKAIQEYRDNYKLIPNKNKKSDIIHLCEKIYKKYYGVSIKTAERNDYLDAFARSLTYCGLFKLSGTGLKTKVRVADHAKLKVDLLLSKYKFKHPKYNNLKEYMDWFGDSTAIVLPWDNIVDREALINDRIEKLDVEKISYVGVTKDTITGKITDIQNRMAGCTNKTKLKQLEKELIDFQTMLNEKNFIEVESKTSTARKQILDKYEDIKHNEEMSALWLEVNTWKSLIAIDGDKTVKRNFNIEEDLTPKSFAPGMGNTPDMELYCDDYVIIPEVSLMTGVRQWEHEGSSVIDHVQSFVTKFDKKKVFGLFISSSINIRTQWQFFILNKESWLGNPVSVIPMTIDQYSKLLKSIYSKSVDINEFIKIIEKIHDIAVSTGNYNDWFKLTNSYINTYSTGLIG